MQEVEFLHEKPEIYNSLKEKFDIDWDSGVIITYGNKVYSKYELSPLKKIHELTHVRQQLAYGVQKWWNEYVENTKFRLEQELEAYRNEIAGLFNRTKDREFRHRYVAQCAKDLSSGMYGNVIEFMNAKQLLRYNENHRNFN